jgi:hypothetical protein
MRSGDFRLPSYQPNLRAQFPYSRLSDKVWQEVSLAYKITPICSVRFPGIMEFMNPYYKFPCESYRRFVRLLYKFVAEKASLTEDLGIAGIDDG